ncbi:hypothetical protein EB796_012287 [Bugula neritina]|uniref:Uncharacterized protein n=1 Tax=Bugula neritina TaxID=10212 RepID=A0A7J7JVQ4_BUGNE|nr:hypothetical protein EB796_012287 [Bugula neritina]
MRILSRLKNVEDLTVIDNSLHDLSGLSFNRCQTANFSKNYFTSFKSLPVMPNLQSLILSFNQIKTLNGLRRFPKLEYLELTGNGIYYSHTYRQRVFKILPSLKVLDKTIKMKTDESGEPGDDEDKDPLEEGTCTLL